MQPQQLLHHFPPSSCLGIIPYCHCRVTFLCLRSLSKLSEILKKRVCLSVCVPKKSSPPPATFRLHPPCAPHTRPIRPFCVSTHSVLPHVCKIESVRRESGSQENVGSRTEQGSRGGRTDICGHPGQAGRFCSRPAAAPPSKLLTHTPPSLRPHLLEPPVQLDPPRRLYSHTPASV